MSKSESLHRYSLILKKVMEDRFPSLNAIFQFLKNSQVELSMRTLQRDMYDLKYRLYINIEYDREKKGYFLDENPDFRLDTFLQLLDASTLSQLWFETITKGREALAHISFGTAGPMRGMENLKPFLEAIQARRKTTFKYRGFFHDEEKGHSINPVLLREYLGRWYVVGRYEGGEKLYTFGLDRISDLVVLKDRFALANGNPASLFDKVIGVFHGETGEESERVLLEFDQDQAKFIKSLPIHSSQRIVSEDSEICLIELKVIPNYELFQRILMYGAAVKVIEPQSLSEEIRKAHEQAAARYGATQPT